MCGLMTITVDIDSLHVHGSTLFASGSKVLKCLFYGVDSGSSSKLGLIDNPYSKQLYLSQDGGAIGTLEGTTNTDHGEAPAMCPIFLTADCGLRVFTSADSGSLIIVVYLEVTS